MPSPDSPPAPAAPEKGPLFWCNLVLLALLAPLASYWFSQHLQRWITEVALIGGGLTLWAFLRVAWSVWERFSKVDLWDGSARLLATPEAARLLIVAAVGLAMLWFSTGSLYFTYEGDGSAARQFTVQVVRKADRAVFQDGILLGGASRVVGQPYFWQWQPTALECVIVTPVGYRPRDCSLQGGKALRLRVPADFPVTSYHLLRLVPRGSAYRVMPNREDTATVHYNLVLQVDGRTLTHKDMRRQTVYVGAEGTEMSQAMAMESAGALEAALRSQFLADGVQASDAAVLANDTVTWPELQVQAGQKITVSVLLTHDSEGLLLQTPKPLDGFPFTYTVSNDKVQTVWMPPR